MNKPNVGGPQKNQKTLKFENEFDFEKANSKFEELRSELSKLKVGTEEIKTNPEQVKLFLLFMSPYLAYYKLCFLILIRIY